MKTLKLFISVIAVLIVITCMSEYKQYMDGQVEVLTKKVNDLTVLTGRLTVALDAQKDVIQYAVNHFNEAQDHLDQALDYYDRKKMTTPKTKVMSITLNDTQPVLTFVDEDEPHERDFYNKKNK